MGKAVPQNIKSKVRELLKTHGSEFGTEFDKNKQVINSFGIPLSKEQRNLVAGYITRLKSKKAS